MPRKETHQKASHYVSLSTVALLGIGSAANPDVLPFLEVIHWAELPIFALVIVMGSQLGAHLPDWIEPPRSPDHRGFAHSVCVYLAVLLKVTIMWLSITPISESGIGLYARFFVFFIGLGYLSHLHFDAHTHNSISWY